ncbi:Uncharacterised protein [Legionella steigerwaltii]|uniref:Uncharacterized protein n=1 Tax=Legionella steigerwaltii TaxID=460 RepID=A0A378LAI2_9GAMM|nr:hypothetical protein [Legionella steigerwaltii]KTD75357.1 hypothetical protein Lstg_2532 [Legionella steigerwaltii]STY23714.1 Uncharacterised protein [Legionella steigerwaltii]
MAKILISLKESQNKQYAKPIQDGDRLDYLFWCLQKADKALGEKKPLWAVEEIFIKSMEQNSQASKLYNLGPAKYKELLNRLADIQNGKYQSTSMVFKGLLTDGPILIEVQSDNVLVLEDSKEIISDFTI